MDAFLLAMLFALGYFGLQGFDERQRIALLGSHLRRYQIEKLMEQIHHGYLRALGEDRPEQRAELWSQLNESEARLVEQVAGFGADIGRLSAEQTRICRVALPFIHRWLPQSTLDLRAVLRIHSDGLLEAACNRDRLSAKGRAHRFMAEMMLLQHTCHWFCKSRAVASVRLMARHRSAYEQVLQAVTPQTHSAYQAWLKG